MIIQPSVIFSALSYEVGFMAFKRSCLVSLPVHVAGARDAFFALSLLLGIDSFTHLGLLVLYNLVARLGRRTSGSEHLREVD
jgi:hypothetical protein